MISINMRDSQPIYEQIKEGVCRLILSGALQTGERLPSVRELAGQLAINPNTIQRAYRELELEGFVYSVAGKGSFVSPLEQVDHSRIDGKKTQFKEAALELLRLGMEKEALIAMLDELKEDSHA